jgi:hypothetical protein
LIEAVGHRKRQDALGGLPGRQMNHFYSGHCGWHAVPTATAIVGPTGR